MTSTIISVNAQFAVAMAWFYFHILAHGGSDFWLLKSIKALVQRNSSLVRMSSNANMDHFVDHLWDNVLFFVLLNRLKKIRIFDNVLLMWVIKHAFQELLLFQFALSVSFVWFYKQNHIVECLMFISSKKCPSIALCICYIQINEAMSPLYTKKE